MNDMLSYIFTNLKTHGRAIKKQSYINRRLNNKVMILGLAMAAYVFVTDIRNLEQNRKIDELNDQIEELKHVKGE